MLKTHVQEFSQPAALAGFFRAPDYFLYPFFPHSVMKHLMTYRIVAFYFLPLGTVLHVSGLVELF